MTIETTLNPGDYALFRHDERWCISRVKMIHMSISPKTFSHATGHVLPAKDAIYEPIIYYEFGTLDRPPENQIVIYQDECHFVKLTVINL